MEINPKEVSEIRVIGQLNDDDVKMVVLKGGLFVAVGKKSKNGKKDQPLAAGSHQGIVAFQISKEFGSDFKESMHKSEGETLPSVENKSSYLPVDLYSKGIELYTVRKNNNLEFIVYRYGLTIGKYETEVEDKSLIIKNCSFNNDYFDIKSPETAKAIAKAMEDKVKELGLNGVRK